MTFKFSTIIALLVFCFSIPFLCQAEEAEKTTVKKTQPSEEHPKTPDTKTEKENKEEKWKIDAYKKAELCLDTIMTAMKKEDLKLLEKCLNLEEGNAEDFFTWVKKNDNIQQAANAMSTGKWKYRVSGRKAENKETIILTVIPSLKKKVTTTVDGKSIEEIKFVDGEPAKFIFLLSEDKNDETDGDNEKQRCQAITLPM